MSCARILALACLAAGLASPARALIKSDPTSARPDSRELELTELYLSLKDAGTPAPAWLEEELFGVAVEELAGDGREGGETPVSALVIAGLPFSDTGNTNDNVNDITPEMYTPLTGCFGGTYWSETRSGRGKDVVYSLTLPAAASITVDLCASGYDTVLGIFTDMGGALGTLVGRSDDVCSTRSKIEACTLDAGSYLIVVDGYNNNGGGAYTLSVTGPCMDAACPAGYSVQEAELLCEDTNGGCNMSIPAYEPLLPGTDLCGTTWADGSMRDTDWYEVVLTHAGQLSLNLRSVCVPMHAVVVADGCPAGNSLYTVSAAAGASESGTSECLPAGTYRVVALTQVYEGFPCADLNHYGLGVRVITCAVPCDDYVCSPLAGSGNVLGNTEGKPNVAGNSAPDDFYCFTPEIDCHVTFSTCSAVTTYDSFLRLWSEGGPCAGGVQLATDDDACDNPGLASILGVDLVGGQSYVLQVEGYNSASGPYELIVDAPCDIVEAVDSPMAFSLKQNMPNPFNPATTIHFTLGATGETSLLVYDLAGREVATLLSGTLERGEHSVVFDAGALPSGVYFYTLQAKGSVETRKMVLLK